MMTISYFFAISCIRRVVGPSGMYSVASYHRGVCSAQKYGPVKISCMQRIWTPAAPELSMSTMCLSMLAWRILFLLSLVEPACDAWIRPHFTFVMDRSGLLSVGERGRLLSTHEGEVDDEAQSERHEPGILIQVIDQCGIRDVPARRHRGANEAGNYRQHGNHQCDHGLRVYAIA